MKATISQKSPSPHPVLTRVTAHDDVRAILELFSWIADEQEWQPGDYLSGAPEGAEHIAVCSEGVMLGGLQVVFPDTDGKLPYLRVWPEVVVPAQSAHVTILGVRPECRGRAELFWTLVCDLWSMGADRGIECYLLEATPPMLTIYRRMGLPLEVIGELRMHWGEPCYLTKVDPVAFAGGIVMRARKSAVFNNLLNVLLQPQRGSAIVEAPQTQVAAV